MDAQRLCEQEYILNTRKLHMEFSLRVIPDSEKPAVLQSYLSRFKWMAWRFFPVRVGSPLVTFEPIAARYPVFELIRIRPEDSSESPDLKK